MNSKLFFTLIVLTIIFTTRPSQAASTYLDNGTITIGVDLNKGGTITYLRDNSDGQDMVNDYDPGREIQQSYYCGPTPYDPYGNQHPSWSNWSWNPVAAGDCYWNWSTLLNWSNDGQTIYTETRPKQWALNNVDTECTMEQWITLDGNIVTVRCRLNNQRTDLTFYGGYPQELPAVYTNYPFRYLYSYTGDTPFTGDSISYIPDPCGFGNAPPWATFYATESWSAMVDDNSGNGFGLGVYHPGMHTFNGGYHGSGGSNRTGHMSPVKREHLDYNIVYEHEYYLIIDDLTGIRNWIYQHRPDQRPNYVFRQNRQSWLHISTTDNGWPVNDYWRVNLNMADPYVVGPYGYWDAADVPIIYIRARYNLFTASPLAQLFYLPADDPTYVGHAVSFNIISDGQYHTYAVDMSSQVDYSGKIQQIRFDPIPGGVAGEYVDIEFISAYPIPGDFDRDNDIDLADFAALAANWLEVLPAEFIGDLTGDRAVGIEDVSILLENWLEGSLTCWPLDETSGSIAYDSFGDNYGIVYGAAWQPTAGYIDGALSFDGANDYVNINSVVNDVNPSQGTIACWMKLAPSDIGNGLTHGLIEIGSSSDTDYFIGLRKISDETIRMRYRSGSVNYDATISDISDFDNWHHVAAVWTDTQVKIYLDGVGQDTQPRGSDISGVLSIASIGRKAQGTSTNYVAGWFDDVRIFDTALGDDEIARLAQ